MKQSNSLVLAILLGAVIISGGIYFGLTKSKKDVKTAFPSPVVTPSPTATPSPSHTPTLSWTKSELITALSEATGIDKDQLEFAMGDKIEQDSKILMRGTVSQKGEMGGAGWYGVVDQHGLRITYAGQGVPNCEQINPYNYPIDWVDYCLDGNGEAIKRN